MTMLKRKRAGLGDAMSVVTRFVNACNRHDADGVYACLHPDFDSIQPMYPSRNFRGADQVRRNWQAIFDAEPGFRLTVLRSAAVDDTVWLELHGAGRDAEVAGVFVMGIQGDRIRWARIYSALVEPIPAEAGAGTDSTASASVREVPRPDQSPSPVGNGDVVEEPLIAPVVDIERSGRRRRRSSRRAEEHTTVAPSVEEAVEAQPEVVPAEPEAAVVADDDVEPVPAPPEPEALVEPDADVPPVPVPEPEVVAPDPAPEGEPVEEVAEVAEVAEAADVAEVVEVAEVAEVVEVVEAAEPEPEPEPPSPEPSRESPPRRRFGKKSR